MSYTELGLGKRVREKMKKVLIFTFLFGVVSLTPAALQISVNGNFAPVDSEILAIPSEILNLDIHGDVLTGQAVYWLMMVDETWGTLFYDYGGIGPFYYYPPSYPGYSWVGGVTDIGPLSGLLIDGIEYHAECAGDAVVNLYNSPDAVTWTLEDQMIIHQGDVPEPVTIALLGLGGLLVSRRRVVSG